MELRIERTEDNKYQLKYGSTILVASTILTEVIDRGTRYAKKFQRKLMISEASLADWYIGFPITADQAPELFYDTDYVVKSSVSGFESPYKFVEGPFSSQESAQAACFRISGKKGIAKEE